MFCKGSRIDKVNSNIDREKPVKVKAKIFSNQAIYEV